MMFCRFERRKEMVFELGKCYRHSTGLEMKIIGLANSTLYGVGYVGEMSDGEIRMVGTHQDNAIGWYQITQWNWTKNFSKH